MEPEWNHGNNEDDAYMLGLREMPMKTSILLNKNVDCNQLCGMVSKMINTYSKSNPDLANTVLVCELKQVIEDIPKIEHNHGS